MRLCECSQARLDDRQVGFLTPELDHDYAADVGVIGIVRKRAQHYFDI
jgi:hypothetical protein